MYNVTKVVPNWLSKGKYANVRKFIEHHNITQKKWSGQVLEFQNMKKKKNLPAQIDIQVFNMDHDGINS